MRPAHRRHDLGGRAWRTRSTPTPQGEPPRREMALGLTYLQAIEAAGGLPVVMPPLRPRGGRAAARPAGRHLPLRRPRPRPGTYGERRHPKLGPVEPELDLFELELARRADARGMPILAICRGLQALNVARGGTLHQHLPDRPGTTLDHRQRAPGDRVTHVVRDRRPGSLLRRVMRRRRARVNSFHHQAVNRLGRGLRAVAWSPDGVIEGIEAPARDFVRRACSGTPRRSRRGPSTPPCSRRWSRRRRARPAEWSCAA